MRWVRDASEDGMRFLMSPLPMAIVSIVVIGLIILVAYLKRRRP
jgi:hypothetical protein